MALEVVRRGCDRGDLRVRHDDSTRCRSADAVYDTTIPHLDDARRTKQHCHGRLRCLPDICWNACFTRRDERSRIRGAAMASTLHFVVTWLVVVQKQSTRKVKAAQQAMHESEERLRLFIEHAPVALAMFDRDMRYLSVSHRWITDYGLGDRDVIGHSHYEIFPDMPERWKTVHQRGLEGEIVRQEEDRFERADGTDRWLCWEVRPWKTDRGRVGGIVILTEDITERKKIELELLDHQAQLQNLTAKLLTAQEEERKRIARDLHDDFTQQLAALTIDLQRQSLLASESGTPHASLLVNMGKKTEQLTTELQRLAHQLHPSLLEHVGLEAAIRECVDEFPYGRE
ncbi:MAG: PAS domain S-box protein [Nitrospira sp.]|nr:PAS domain S-box protein [Nitrospira sp.]